MKNHHLLMVFLFQQRVVVAKNADNVVGVFTQAHLDIYNVRDSLYV